LSNRRASVPVLRTPYLVVNCSLRKVMVSPSRATSTCRATVLADGITVLIVGGTQRGCFVSTNTLSSAELFKYGEYFGSQTSTLTGYCIARENTTIGCVASPAPTACPVGQAAIGPTTVRDFCGTGPSSSTTLDDLRGCVAKSRTGVFQPGGHCMAQ